MADERRDNDTASTKPGGPIAQIPTWKKALVLLSIALMIFSNE